MWKFNFLLLSICLTGCSTVEKTAVEAGASAGGAGVGYAVSGGNKWATAGGAALGLGVAKIAESKTEKRLKEAYRLGFEDGRRQAVRQQFEIVQTLQKQSDEDSEKTELVPVSIPEQEIDGKLFQARTEWVKVVR